MVRAALLDLVGRELRRPVPAQLGQQAFDVPLVAGIGHAVGLDRGVDRLRQLVHGRLAQVGPLEDLVAARVDDLALLVHHLVVLEDVLADLAVALLDGVLGPLDGLRDHLRLDGHLVGEGLAHHPAHGAGGEEAHQLVVEAQVEPALARIALTARPTPELVVDAPALVALGAEHVEPAQLADLVAVGLALRPELLEQLVVAGEGLGADLAVVLRQLVERRRQVELVDERLGREPLAQDLLTSQALGVATEQDVDATTGHVRGDGDGARPAGLGDDHGLTRVLLGVEDLVVDTPLAQLAGQVLRLLDRDRADQDRLALVGPLDQVLHHRVELGDLGLVDLVGLVGPHHGSVRGHGHHGQPVGVHQLGGLGLGRTGHAGELVVHAEVVLQGDRREGLVLLLDLHPFLGLDGLVDALRPAPTLQDAAGELVDDLHLAGLDDVVLVPLVQLLGLQGGRQLVHEVLLHLVVEVLEPEGPLHPTDAVLGGRDRALLLVDLVVLVAPQAPGDGGELVVELGGVGDTARDDERRAGLVDEDGVDLVDDGVDVASLDLVDQGGGHVVAQVVEAELVVGAVRDVGRVHGPLLLGLVLQARDDQPDIEPEPPVDLTHPLGVTSGQVVVHRDDVHAPAGEPVEVGRKRRDERLALAGLHLGHPAEVEGGAAHHLDVVVALADHPLRGLAHHRERLDQQLVEVLAVGQTLAELGRLGLQGLVGEGFHLVLEGADVGHDAGQGLHLLAFAGAQDLVEDAHRRTHATGGLSGRPCAHLRAMGGSRQVRCRGVGPPGATGRRRPAPRPRRRPRPPARTSRRRR